MQYYLTSQYSPSPHRYITDNHDKIHLTSDLNYEV